MIYRIFSCLNKGHGSLKYFKGAVFINRLKGSKSKKPAIKIFAASSVPASSVKHNSYNDLKQKTFASDCIQNKESSSNCNSELANELHNDTISEKVFAKPFTEPDVIISTDTLKDNKSDKNKSVKLLNTVKPSDLEWQKQVLNFQLFPTYYKSLSKFRLTGLVVITTLTGYGMAPGPIEPVTLLFLILGTGLTSAAANTINQILEVPYDSQMARTKNRVLTRGLITPLHASIFAASCASIGLPTLYFGTNAITCILGASNLILYTSIYTPLKRCSITNTWLGSIVGAIPPMMGWAACSGTLNSGAILMGAILYSWQFPHFNALSWNLRPDYSKAGYRMTSVINPDLCRRTALRHSVLLLLLCSSAPLLDLTTWTFAVDSLPLNCYLIYTAWKFYKNADSQSSRKLFRLSLIYLPTLMLLMFIGKKYPSNSDKNKDSNL